jgi:hypothetical protein
MLIPWQRWSKRQRVRVHRKLSRFQSKYMLARHGDICVSSIDILLTSANEAESLLVTSGVTSICILLFLLGGVQLRKPDIEAWLKKSKPAFESPALLAAIHGESGSQRKAA